MKTKTQKREPTPKQAKALELWLEHGRTKGQAMRAAGYSEAVSLQPGKVFNSPAIQHLLDKAGINPVNILEQLHKKAFATHIKTMKFDGADEEMTDAELRQLFNDEGMKVFRLRHNDDESRTVYYFADNDLTNLEAIEKIINLYGLYAPKRVESKNTHIVGSLADLRKKMREKGITIIEHGDAE